MKIKSVDVGYYRIPLPIALSDSRHGYIRDFELVTVTIESDNGLQGVGYTYTGGYGGRAIASLVKDDLIPLLLGEESTAIESLWEKMWWRVHYVGRGGAAVFAIAAVDIALWDMKSKMAELPLWKFLGGKEPCVKAYAGGVDLQFSTEQLLEQTEQFMACGFNALKMKVGRDSLSEDISRVARVRDCIGPETTLMVDANMGWTIDQAIRASRALSEFGIYWLEEPTIPDDFLGHARIQQAGSLPLAAGENLHSIYEFNHLMTAGGVTFPEPDVATVGGITVWLKVAHLAESHNLEVTSHGVHDLHVHLLAAVPNASFLEIHAFGLDSYMETPLKLEEGLAVAPDCPGHGVHFNWDALEPCRTV